MNGGALNLSGWSPTSTRDSPEGPQQSPQDLEVTILERNQMIENSHILYYMQTNTFLSR